MEKLKGYFGKGISFLKDPGRSFDAVKKEHISEGFKFMLLLSVIWAFLTGLITGLMSLPLELSVLAILGAVVAFYVFTVVSALLWGLWLHLWIYIFGARKGLERTMKTVFYGLTPVYLIGWIPYISAVALVWSFILQGIGVSRFHALSGGRTAGAMIIAVAIPLAVFLVLFTWAYMILGPMMFDYSFY